MGARLAVARAGTTKPAERLSGRAHGRGAPPERADLVLASDVPHGEVDVLVLDGLHVEADRGDGGDDLAEFQLVQDRGFTGRVEPHHQDAHLLLGEEALEHALEGSHGCRRTRAPAGGVGGRWRCTLCRLPLLLGVGLDDVDGEV